MSNQTDEGIAIASPQYSQWRAPAEDGELLIWPEPPRLLRDVEDNHRRLRSCDSVLLQNVPLAEVRRRQRHWIGHTEDDQPLLATGHQTELYHPGVWVKNALIHAAAGRVGGVAYHLAVDTDSPKHLHLRWPGESQPITNDPALTSAAWSGQLDAPTPQWLAHLEATFTAAASQWKFTPMIEPFFAAMRKLSLESPNLSAALTQAIHTVEWDLGLRHHAMLTSPLWTSESYLLLAHHLLARPRETAEAYNQSLAEYRISHQIRSAARPMPDLPTAAEVCETPFWLDDLAAGERRRATVTRVGGGAQAQWALAWPAPDERGNAAKGAADVFIFDPAADGWEAAGKLAAFLRRHHLRLAPRALMLTAFFRLLVADQFVHGIGGGRYDQVTDKFIARFFKMPPPKFAVTTATLYFPSAAGQRRINLRPLVQEGRRLRHGLLDRAKMQTVKEIEQLPRHSRQRRELYHQMHARLAEQSNGPAMQDWERQFRAAEHESLRQATLFDRELFFAIQPSVRLLHLIRRCERELA